VTRAALLLNLAVLAGLVGCDDPVTPAPGASPEVVEAVTAPDPEPSQVCVVRHAEAFRNLAEPPADLDAEGLDALTERGEEQARALAGRLPENVTVVWASPTGRTRETAALLEAGPEVVDRPELRSLGGAMEWDERRAAVARGEDPRPESGESLADGGERARAVLAGLQQALDPGENGVLVTHGDMAALLIGELRGTPLLARPERHALATGAMACAVLGTGEDPE
tara:strand:+ start:372 stop:1046 length:675 start_codon:yes stop_codon:yes gene_type:complete